jgi:hypothetical protein
MWLGWCGWAVLNDTDKRMGTRPKKEKMKKDVGQREEATKKKN